jgi:hypothetical protein
MGFRRLSILDLSMAGHQPMSFAGGRYWLTFNGEIYNFRELRAGLDGEMERESSGDSAVLGELLKRHGPRAVLPKLRGMFAFAWSDGERRELFAARDGFGIKPLYYAQNESGGFGVGSELRSVAELAGCDTVNPAALAQYFRWGSVQALETMVDGVRCLEPGHWLAWRDGRLEKGRWFAPVWSGGEMAFANERAVAELVRSTVMGTLASRSFRGRGLLDTGKAADLVDRLYRASEVRTTVWRDCQVVWLMVVLEEWLGWRAGAAAVWKSSERGAFSARGGGGAGGGGAVSQCVAGWRSAAVSRGAAAAAAGGAVSAQFPAL